MMKRSAETITISPETDYREITVKLWGKGVVLRGMISGAEIAGSRRFVTKPGQFILSRIDARNGAIGIVPADLDGAVVTNDFPLFDLDHNKLHASFLGWLSKTQDFVELCQRASEGTTNRVRLQEHKFLDLEIHLPPLVEQRRIVTQIEELAAKVHGARALRRQAVEEAEAFLTASRRAAIVDCEAETIDLEYACLEIIDNLHSNPRYAETGIPCIRSPDVRYGTLNLDGAFRTNEAEYRRRTVRGEPQLDDIVLVREGGGTGKCALVSSGERLSLGQRVMMLRPNQERVLPRFFLYQLLSPLVQEDQIGPLSKGSASPHLNIGALKRFSLRIPPLSEQRRIVAYLDNLHMKLDALKKLQAATAAELDALLPSILDKAFKGEL
jgi:type I restriction enzyme S subunit